MTGGVVAVLGVIAFVALIGALFALGVVLRARDQPRPPAPDPTELEELIYAELYGGRTGMVHSVDRRPGARRSFTARDQRPGLAGADGASAAAGEHPGERGEPARDPAQPAERGELAHSG